MAAQAFMRPVQNAAMTAVMTSPFDSSQLSALVEALPDPAVIVGGQGAVLAANQQAMSFFAGVAPGVQLTSALRTPAVLRAVSEAVSQAKAARVQHVARAPVQQTYDVYVSPLGGRENSGPLALLILRDLTREEQVERMRSDFVANASHELRTPLASLTGFIETLQGAAKNDVKARDAFLVLMKAQADRMARLIDDLLSLSRIEISEHVPPQDRADLAHVARQAAEMLAPMAKEAGCALRIALPPSLPVTGDAGQLSQVLLNLIENAIKYAGSGKAVDIEGKSENGAVTLSVRDHGPGIAAHHVPRLTERFYRVSVQDSRSRGGTGLGLAIAKHIISRHRGRLLIESELGRGSTFSIHMQSAK
jgi:two-component system, OmpR family, phosphate regulon sensor histidine kinase PhoR